MANNRTKRTKRKKFRKALRLQGFNESEIARKVAAMESSGNRRASADDICMSFHEYAEMECGLDYLSECGDK